VYPSEQLEAGEILLLTGEFSDQTFECPLQKLAGDANGGNDLWACEIELPFQENQARGTGIFRYRYALLPVDGDVGPILEDAWRVVYCFRSAYLNTFCYNSNNPRLLPAYLLPAQKHAIRNQI
jgi:hypothetical protein